MIHPPKIYVAGHLGMVGWAIVRQLLAQDRPAGLHHVHTQHSRLSAQHSNPRLPSSPAKTALNWLHYGDLTDTSNLGAQSHVAVSFESPEYTADVDGMGTLRILEKKTRR